MKPVQYFSEEYLNQCRKMMPKEIIRFLEDYRMLQAKPAKTKLISIKIDENLLSIFRQKADLNNVKYQTMIKKLMQDWVSS
ncbi:MAG: hypothetical protein KDD58_13695 [Bdellovibrionales bacterium]|nr:hypothetical protein [Bdellovibrionales bacterium]